MNCLHSEVTLDSPKDAIIIEVKGTEANVLVLDGSNFSAYRRGQRFRYLGGHYRSSPVVITPPHPGQWHVVIDLGGQRGHVQASVTVGHEARMGTGSPLVVAVGPGQYHYKE